jgi:hypothetical protein
MVRRTSKKVVWKKSPAERAAEIKPPPPIVRVVPRGDDFVLLPGQLFTLTCTLSIVQDNPRFQKSPVPYATAAYYGSAIPVNSLAIFIGHTRVEEMDGTHVMSILRPTFVVDGKKIIPTNLNFLQPVI